MWIVGCHFCKYRKIFGTFKHACIGRNNHHWNTGHGNAIDDYNIYIRALEFIRVTCTFIKLEKRENIKWS